MSKSFVRASMAAKSLLLAGVAAMAFGNEVLAADGGIEEVVVTAEKRSENVQNIPSSISAFTAEDLKERGIVNMGDLAQQVPGVNFGEVAGAPQIASRGHHHILVSKGARGGVTTADVTILDGEARIAEIARMLGGYQESDVSRAHARELLDAANVAPAALKPAQRKKPLKPHN